MTFGRRAFITGAAALAAFPVRADHKTRLVVTGDMGVVGKRMAPYLSQKYDWVGIDIKRGPDQDVSLPDWGKNVLPGSYAILHLAWDVPNFNSIAGAMYNTAMTENVLLSGYMAGVRRFIFASSAWAAPDLYGHNKGRAIPAIYSENKRFVEGMLSGFGARTGISTSSIRFGQVNPMRDDQRLDTDFDSRVLMTDADLAGLLDLAMQRYDRNPIGPFDAR